MNDGTAFQKRRQLLEMLDKGLVMLHLDPRPEEVIIPAYLKTEPVLRLNLAYGFRLPALDVGAEGVYAVLSFNRQNFGCTLPWGAVFAMTMPDNGHDGVLWPGSLPPELKPVGDAGEAGVSVALKPAIQAVEGTAIQAVEGTAIQAVEGTATTEVSAVEREAEPVVDAPPEPKRPHLRLVKG